MVIIFGVPEPNLRQKVDFPFNPKMFKNLMPVNRLLHARIELNVSAHMGLYVMGKAVLCPSFPNLPPAEWFWQCLRL